MLAANTFYQVSVSHKYRRLWEARMPTTSTPEDQADSKTPANPPQASAEPAAMRVSHERPEFVRSEYPNHVTVYRSGVGGSAEEVTLAFWQVSPLGIDQEKGTAKATYLGSYVLSMVFAESVLRVLAENLGYTVSKGSDDHGD